MTHYNTVVIFDKFWKLTHTGGNCTAYQHDLPDGKYLLITEREDARIPEPGEEAIVGLYSSEGDCLPNEDPASYGIEVAGIGPVHFFDQPFPFAPTRPYAHLIMINLLEEARHVLYQSAEAARQYHKQGVRSLDFENMAKELDNAGIKVNGLLGDLY